MELNRISIDSDLSEASLQDAVEQVGKFGERGNVKTLVVSPADMKVACNLVRGVSPPVIVKVDPRLHDNAWYIYGTWSGMFSPGA